MAAQPTVFIVDDDEGVLRGLEMLCKSVGLNAKCYDSALKFLDDCDPAEPGCLILDIRMPGMSGLELQATLAERKITLPVIVISGHADVPIAVRSMKLGAFEFVEKPFRNQFLLDRIQQAIARDAENRRRQEALKATQDRLASLTERERQVAELIVEGKTTKAIALELGISAKTVEFHRANLMQKLGAEAVADLVRIVMAARREDRTESSSATPTRQ